MLEVPIVVVVCGEGGSGGALGIAIGDRVLMQEFAVYSVIPPEGCAAILWRDANRKVEAAAALKITAPGSARARPDRRRSSLSRPAARTTTTTRATALVDQALSRGARRVSAADGRRAARRTLREVPPDGRRRQRVHRADAGHRRAPDVGLTRSPQLTMKSLLWQHLPCDDDQAAALAAALSVHPTVARLLCMRGFGDRRGGRALPQPVARSAARSVPPRRHGRAVDAARAGAGAQASASPSTATTTSTASRRR